jgi:hypothetical protein
MTGFGEISREKLGFFPCAMSFGVHSTPMYFFHANMPTIRVSSEKATECANFPGPDGTYRFSRFRRPGVTAARTKASIWRVRLFGAQVVDFTRPAVVITALDIREWNFFSRYALA